MARRDSLAGLGEFGLLRRLLPGFRQSRSVLVGPGDDCAVVRSGGRKLLLTTDALVVGVHFEPSWLKPEEIGAKAVLVNLSDIAAMGGMPKYLLLSIGVPSGLGRGDLLRLHRGAERAARRHGAAIVGGNLSSADRLFVSITAVGEARKPVLRSGAKPGDLLFVTGTLGDAAAAVEWLKTLGVVAAGVPRSAAKRAGERSRDVRFLVRRFASPTPRLETARRIAEAGLASAMIDISDGLIQDLGHICEASGVGAVVSEADVPRSRAYDRVIGADTTLSLRGGEDYELLFAVPPRRLVSLDRLRDRLPDRLSLVGEIVAGRRGVRVRDHRGKLRRLAVGGYQHFAPA